MMDTRAVDVLFPTGSVGGRIFVLQAFFDDSGTHSDSEVVSIGGLIGTPDQWRHFEQAWKAKLADPLPGYGKPPLRMFHQSYCKARTGEFAGWTEGKCDAVTHDFRQILIQARLAGTASMVDRKAWDELMPPEAKSYLGSCTNVCLENCLVETLKIADHHAEGETIAVVIDRGIWTPQLKELTDSFTYHLGRPRVVSVAFSKVEDVLPLQGADIPATENYWYACKLIREGLDAAPRPHMLHYMQNMFAEGFLVSRDQMLTLIPDLMKGLAEGGDRPWWRGK